MDPPGRKNIDWEESMSVIVQALHAAGFEDTAKRLGSDIPNEQPLKFAYLRSQFLGGFWENSIETLLTIHGLTKRNKMTARCIILRMWSDETETLNRNFNENERARYDRSKHSINISKLENRDVPSLLKELQAEERLPTQEMNGLTNILELRREVLKELESCIPCMVPKLDRELLTLVSDGISAKLNSCHSHNRNDPNSLYCDHSCYKDHLPTKTIKILTGHEQAITCVKFSRNGLYLASASGSTFIIWEVPATTWELKERHTVKDHKSPITCVSWSHNDRLLLTCAPLEHIKIWDVLTGKCRGVISRGEEVLRSCAYLTSDPSDIVYGKSMPPGSIRLRRNKNHYEKRLVSFPRTEGRRLNVDLAVTPNGSKLIYFDTVEGRTVRVLHIATNIGKRFKETAHICGIAVSEDSESLIVNIMSDEIHVWDLNSLDCRPLTYWGFKHVESGTSVSCIGGVESRFLATGTENSKVCIWNRRYGRPIAVLSGHTSAVRCVSWNPERPQMLASAGDDKTICIWGPQRQEVQHA